MRGSYFTKWMLDLPSTKMNWRIAWAILPQLASHTVWAACLAHPRGIETTQSYCFICVKDSILEAWPRHASIHSSPREAELWCSPMTSAPRPRGTREPPWHEWAPTRPSAAQGRAKFSLLPKKWKDFLTRKEEFLIKEEPSRMPEAMGNRKVLRWIIFQEEKGW